MGRKRANRQPGRVTGKEGAIHLDDWLDGPEDDYIDFEDNPAYSGTGGSMGINRKLTRREKKAMEKAAKVFLFCCIPAFVYCGISCTIFLYCRCRMCFFL